MAISNSGVGIRPGVCTSTTRPTAPYEGQMIYETDTDKTLFWNGTAWVNVNSVSPDFTGTPTAPTATAGTNTTQLATTAFATTAGGLVHITNSTVGTGVSTHTVSSCFSSSYDNYKIIYAAGVGSNPVAISMQLGASVTGYYQGLQYVSYGTGAVSSTSNNNAASWGYIGEASASMTAINVDVHSPFLAKFSTMFGGYSGTVAGTISGYHGVATSYTGFTLATAGNTMTGGTVTVYGYRK